MLSIINFINVFMIPIIGTRIYYKRHNMEWKWSFDFVFWYALLCVLNLPVLRVCALLLEKMIGTIITIDSTKYTLVAVFVTIMIPYIIEIFEKYIQIDITIEKVVKRGEENEN